MIYQLTTVKEYTSRAQYMAGDAHRICVVRANSEEEARRHAADKAGDEGASAWLDPLTKVAVLPDGGPPEIMGWW